MKYERLRCSKHGQYIPSAGCAICKEIDLLKVDHLHKIIDKNLIIEALENQIAEYKEAEKTHSNINKAKSELITKLESPETPEEVKEAIQSLTRNEKQIMINTIGSHAMIAVTFDHFLTIPEKRRIELKPLENYMMNICERLDYLNAEIAIKMGKELGVKNFENILDEIATTNDFMSGKIKKCHTCTAWLDQKSINKKIIKPEV